MIAGIFHQGSGLGNQLHRYVATRVLALDKGYIFGMIAPKLFKGQNFMKIDTGEPVNRSFVINEKTGETQVVLKIRNGLQEEAVWQELTEYYNPEFNFIEDNTIIDGEFQSIQYFGHRLKEIDEWLKVEPLSCDENLCVIGFRGGEYYAFPELGLPKSYFEEGIKMMKEINPDMRFEVHTDDPELAKQFFPNYKIIRDIGINWRANRYAKYAIIANTSFCILPRLLSGGVTIAPRYWARRNIGEWSRPDNYYPQFKYI